MRVLVFPPFFSLPFHLLAFLGSGFESPEHARTYDVADAMRHARRTRNCVEWVAAPQTRWCMAARKALLGADDVADAWLVEFVGLFDAEFLLRSPPWSEKCLELSGSGLGFERSVVGICDRQGQSLSRRREPFAR